MITFSTPAERIAFVERVYRFFNYAKDKQTCVKIVPGYINGKIAHCVIRLNNSSLIAAFISGCNGIEYITTRELSTGNKDVLSDYMLKLYNLTDDAFCNIPIGCIYEDDLEELQFVIQTLYEQNDDEVALKMIIDKVGKKEKSVSDDPVAYAKTIILPKAPVDWSYETQLLNANGLILLAIYDELKSMRMKDQKSSIDDQKPPVEPCNNLSYLYENFKRFCNLVVPDGDIYDGTLPNFQLAASFAKNLVLTCSKFTNEFKFIDWDWWIDAYEKVMNNDEPITKKDIIILVSSEKFVHTVDVLNR